MSKYNLINIWNTLFWAALIILLATVKNIQILGKFEYIVIVLITAIGFTISVKEPWIKEEQKDEN